MMIQTVPKGETLSEILLSMAHEIPGGERVNLCLQCGVCSGSCPVAFAMEYTPRQVIAALRAGQLDRVLASNTPWLCASCFQCTVRCPSGIPLTDLMYAVKRLALSQGTYPTRVMGPALPPTFAGIVEHYGRNSEPELMARLYLRKNPLGLVKMAPLGLRLLLKKRLSILPDRVKGWSLFQKVLRARKERGEE